MNKNLARICVCLIVLSFALQLSSAAAASNPIDVQGRSRNVDLEKVGPETGYPPDYPDEKLDPEFEANFEAELDRHYQDYLLNADLPEEVIAAWKRTLNRLRSESTFPRLRRRSPRPGRK